MIFLPIFFFFYNVHVCTDVLLFQQSSAAEFTVPQPKEEYREERDGCLCLRVERRRHRRGWALMLQGPGRNEAAIGLGLIPGARPVLSLFNLRIENRTRVGPGSSLVFTHSLNKCWLGRAAHC